MRVVACVSSSPRAGHVVRRARTLADELGAEWGAVFVETPSSHSTDGPPRPRALEHLRLAEHLGGHTRIVQGRNVAAALVAFADDVDADTMVLGAPTRRRWRDLWRGSVIDRVARRSESFDMLLVDGDRAESDAPSEQTSPATGVGSFDAFGTVATAVGLGTGTGLLIRDWVADVDLVMVFLLGVVWVAYRTSKFPALVAALLSVASFDFFFVRPYYTFAVYNLRYLLTFAVMVGVSVAFSELASRMKRQAEAARRREKSTAALYELAQSLAVQQTPDTLLDKAVERIRDVFETGIIIYETSHSEGLVSRRSAGDAPDSSTDAPAVEDAFDQGEPAGVSTPHLPGAEGYYVPIEGVSQRIGVLGVRARSELEYSDPARRHLLEAHAHQLGIFWERLRLSEEYRDTRIELESERVRNAILSSVSHDLKTPLSSIMGSAGTLQQSWGELPRTTRDELLTSIVSESQRLHRLLDNLLSMTRIEGGGLELSPEWHLPSELVGGAVSQLDHVLGDREVDIDVSSHATMLELDGPLVQQVLVNLIENAHRYSRDGEPIEVSVEVADAAVFEVADRGPGIPSDEQQRIFEKFYQRDDIDDRGTGLGLAISQAIVRAHGGTIEVGTRSDGHGAVFTFEIPQTEEPPEALEADSLPPLDTKEDTR